MNEKDIKVGWPQSGAHIGQPLAIVDGQALAVDEAGRAHRYSVNTGDPLLGGSNGVPLGRQLHWLGAC